MISYGKALRFFLGANTPQGFVSRFDQMDNAEAGWRKFIIKGGPGSGKSTMMKKIADAVADDENMEFIHCSSDVDSLDGIIVPGRGFCVADGTAPHVIEPKYPGAVESLVNINGCWDDSKLYSYRDEIISLSKSCSKCHEYCCRYLNAAGSLAGDTYRIALDCVNTAKLSAYCGRLAEKELKPVKNNEATEKVRFLSAVTNKGVAPFTETAKSLCDRIYLINDDYGAVSRLILLSMRANAMAAGYDIISCYCPLSPFEKLEHLFIPALKLGFMTSNRFHDFSLSIDPNRLVNSQRFTDNDKLRENKKRIAFNRKAAAQMVTQAETLLREAKTLHDELEGYYTNATDFDAVNRLTDEIIGKVTG